MSLFDIPAKKLALNQALETWEVAKRLLALPEGSVAHEVGHFLATLLSGWKFEWQTRESYAREASLALQKLELVQLELSKVIADRDYPSRGEETGETPKDILKAQT